MKAEYKKPMVYFESFEVSTSICGSCGVGVNKTGYMGGYPSFADPQQDCGWKDSTGAVIMFGPTSSACQDATAIQVGPDADGVMYCYNAGTNSGFTMFTS